MFPLWELFRILIVMTDKEKNTIEYEKALTQIAVFISSSKRSDKEMDSLWQIVTSYELESKPFQSLNPVEAIELRLHQLNCGRGALTQIIGSKSRASEIMHYKRKLNLEMIRKIYQYLRIPLEILIQPYELKVIDYAK